MKTEKKWKEGFKTSMVSTYHCGKIGKLVLNRPEIHNAFNPELIAQLKEVFKNLEEDQKIRVVILTGAGKSFCAGADLNWMKEMNQYSMEENIDDSLTMAKFFRQLQHFSKPLIGQINGAAMGGGVGLVSICDGVVAQENAKFAFSEVKLGLIPAVISPYILQKIGLSHARQLILSGERFSAAHAKEIGLVHEVCSLEKLEETTTAFAQKYVNNGPEAMAHAKRLIHRLSDISENEVHFTATAIAEQRVSVEGQEGIQALLEKRKPSFFVEE